MVKVTRVARAAARARLADETTGFNPLLAAALADMNIETPANWRLPVDFSTDASRSFFMADIAPEDFAVSTAHTWPLVTLFAVSAANANRAKFHAFSGPVTLGLNVHVTWPGTKALVEMEAVCDAIEETVFAAFNAKAIAEWAMEADHRLVYNGDLTVQRGRMARAAESWRQDLFGRLSLDVFDDN
jgi:hypothetical protein